MEENLRSSEDNRVSPSKLVGSILRTQGDVRRSTFETEMKAAGYEAMMRRFQLRRLSSHANPAQSPGSNCTAEDKYLESAPHKRSITNHRLSLARFSRQLSKRVLHSPSSQLSIPVILPRSHLATLHGLLMLCAFHFQIFYLPFAPIFFPSGSATSNAVNVALEVVFLLNVVAHLNVAYIENKRLVTSRRQIVRHYAKGWLLVDLISAVPVQIIRRMLGTTTDNVSPLVLHDSVLIVLRLLRLSFSGRIFLHRVLGNTNRLTAWINYSRYSHLVGIVRMIWIVLVMAHYMACFWHLFADDDPAHNPSVAESYIANYYYAVMLIHGQGNLSKFWGENLYATALVLIGSVMVATIFGNVAMLISNFNANATNYQRKMEVIFATMDKMGLPDRLRDRIQQYYTHVWSEYESLDGDLVKFQRELTHTLGLEVGLFKYMGLVNDISFWVECSPDFIAQIVLTITVRVYLPDDFVVRRGEICDEMFVINRGVCERSASRKAEDQGKRDMDKSFASNSESSLKSAASRSSRRHALSSRTLFDPSAKAVYSGRVHPKVGNSGSDGSSRETPRSLYPGETFSEMSLLMNYRQPSSIRAASFVELCILQRDTFQRIISRHPKDRRRVLTNMIKSCIEEGQVPFPWEDLCRANTSKRRNPGCERDGKPWEVITPAEAAQILARQIDLDLPDESIKYGFQSFATPREENCADPNCRYDGSAGGGSNDKVLKMLQELAVTLNRVEDDVRQLKAKHSNASEASPTHNSTRLEAEITTAQQETRSNSCDQQSGGDSGKPVEFLGQSPTQTRLLLRSPYPSDQHGWSHRGSARQIGIRLVEFHETSSAAKPTKVDAETQTSREQVTNSPSSSQSSRSGSLSNCTPMPNFQASSTSRILGHAPSVEPSRLTQLAASFRQPRQHSVPRFERPRSLIPIADSTRIFGEPESKTASATALADQLWRQR